MISTNQEGKNKLSIKIIHHKGCCSEIFLSMNIGRVRGFHWLDQKFRGRPGSNSDRLLDSTRRGFILNLFITLWMFLTGLNVPDGRLHLFPSLATIYSAGGGPLSAIGLFIFVKEEEGPAFINFPRLLKKKNLLARLRHDWLRRFRVAQRLARRLRRRGWRALGLDNSLEEGGISPSQELERLFHVGIGAMADRLPPSSELMDSRVSRSAWREGRRRRTRVEHGSTVPFVWADALCPEGGIWAELSLFHLIY